MLDYGYASATYISSAIIVRCCYFTVTFAILDAIVKESCRRNYFWCSVTTFARLDRSPHRS